MDINRAFRTAFQHYQSGNLQSAVSICEKILKKNHKNVAVLHFLGVLYQQLQNYDAAIKYLKIALQLDRNSFEGFYNLGSTFEKKGELNEAIDCYRKVVQLNPKFVDAYIKLGNAFQLQRRLDEAITYFQTAIQLNPNLADVFFNLGLIFQDKEKLDEAITNYRKAIHLNPNLTYAYLNLGSILHEQGKQDEATMVYDKAICIKPNNIIVRLSKCIAQLPILHPDQQSIKICRDRYYDELIKLKDLISLKTKEDIEDAANAVGIQRPFYLAYQGRNDRELQQIYGNLVCRIMALKYPQFSESHTISADLPDEPLRVGIVTAYFYNHSVWKIPIKGWIENLDKKRFYLYGYYINKIEDDETEVAKRHFTRFVDDVYSFEDLCQIIRNDKLHVLIYPEIGMDLRTLRLAALKLAPIQCVSWGHPETSGLPTIDYYLSSELMEPENADDHYTEKLIRLPNLSIYYSPLDLPCANVDREAFGLSANSIIYHCCQTVYKYLPQYDEIFPSIAQQVGDCQFIFSSYRRSDLITEQFKLRIKKAFNRFHLNADDYAVFLPFLEVSKYSALYKLSDVFLDPIGWSGCNSAFEAITYNLPIVTFPTMLMRGRDSFAILTMMGVTETISSSIDDYITIAIRLGKDSEWRRHISDKISNNKHLVYRDRKCITALEDFLEKSIKKH
jgi:protein O-GlcNAc transferase